MVPRCLVPPRQTATSAPPTSYQSTVAHPGPGSPQLCQALAASAAALDPRRLIALLGNGDLAGDGVIATLQRLAPAKITHDHAKPSTTHLPAPVRVCIKLINLCGLHGSYAVLALRPDQRPLALFSTLEDCRNHCSASVIWAAIVSRPDARSLKSNQ